MSEQGIAPKTFEVVVYDDGTSAISEFDRGEYGHLTYVGRQWLDATQTMRVLQAMAACGAVSRDWLSRAALTDATEQALGVRDE